MADTQEQDIAATVGLLLTDMVRVITDPGGVPESKKITFANFQAAITTLQNLTSLLVPDLRKRTTATFTKNNSTVLANIPDLSVNLVAGKNYRFTARLHCTANASGGVKTAMSGTATFGLLIYDASSFSDALAPQKTRGTAFGVTVGRTAASTVEYMEIKGFIMCTVNGTLTVQFAQNTANASDSIVQIGSTLFVDEVL